MAIVIPGNNQAQRICGNKIPVYSTYSTSGVDQSRISSEPRFPNLHMAGFTDANIPLDSGNPLRIEQRLTTLQKLGYKTATVSHTIELISHITPAPETESWKSKCGLKVYTRLTAVLSDTSHLHVLSQDAAKSYDLLAVQPQTEKLFQQCCGSLEVDIIALDMTQRIPFYLKPPRVRQAIERGIHFEILYSPMILDSTARRYIISTSKDLVQLTRGKNIIISSGAEKPIDLRGPYDIINLGLLFGLNESIARKAILDNCRSALLHAQARNATAKGVVSVTAVDKLKAEDLWQLKQHKDDVNGGRSESIVSPPSAGSRSTKRRKKRSTQTGNRTEFSSGSKRAKHVTDIGTDLHGDQEQTV